MRALGMAIEELQHSGEFSVFWRHFYHISKERFYLRDDEEIYLLLSLIYPNQHSVDKTQIDQISEQTPDLSFMDQIPESYASVSVSRCAPLVHFLLYMHITFPF